MHPRPQHVGARLGQGTGEVGKEAGPVGGRNRDLGGVHVGSDPAGGGRPRLGGPADQSPVGPDLVVGEGGEVGVLHGLGPFGQGRAGSGQAHAGVKGSVLVVSADGGGIFRPAPTPEQGLGGPVELAKELALPAVPDPGTHGADIRHGQDQEQSQPLGRLDDPGEVEHGAGIGDVTFLGVIAHDQVMFNQPGDQLDPLAGLSEALAGLARCPGAGLFLPAGAALAGVVQQHGQEQGLAVTDQGHDGGGQGMVLGKAAIGDPGDHAHRPEGVLIHSVRMVHVELHLGDDAAPFGQVSAKHVGLVHQGQGPLRVATVGEDVEHDRGRCRVPAHPRPDKGKMTRGRGEGVRM